MPLLTRSLQPGFFITCMYCNTHAVVQTSFPLILRSWADMPIPEGWDLRLFMDERVSEKPEVHAVCETCQHLHDTDLEAFLGRTERARDLVQVDGLRTMAGHGRGR